MNYEEHDVVIVGAGPTGLTLANLLGQAGINVLLVERNAATVAEPRAVSIDDESLRAMQAICLSDEVVRNVALDYGSYYFGPSGRPFLKVHPTTREFGFPRRNGFAQPVLEATLRGGLSRHPGVKADFGCECITVSESAECVTLVIEESFGASRAVRARYVVGCDGAHSMIRKQIGASLGGSTYRQRWLIVDLASTEERLRQTRVVCDPSRPFITLPGPGGTRRYEFVLHDDESEVAASDLLFARTLLAESGPDGEAPIVRQQVYAFHARIADRWQTQRIFLAGDAAHLSPPFAGQGMNSGIRDAFNLGWKLAAVVKGELGPGLLATYQCERAPHAWALIELAIKMGHVMMPSSPLQAWAVRMAFGVANFLPSVQSYFAEMKYKPKPYYKRGFIVADSDQLDLVGRMLPQPQIELNDHSRMPLDELLGNGFSLLACGPDAQEIAEIAGRLDFGLPGSRITALFPHDYNITLGGGGLTASARALTSCNRDQPFDINSLLVLRPDRHVLAATTGSAEKIRNLAKKVQALAQSTSIEIGRLSVSDAA